MASTVRRTSAVTWFTERGSFRTLALILILLGFGAVMGFSKDVIHWLRWDIPFSLTSVRYSVLFAGYHMLTAGAVVAVLRRRSAREWSRWTIPLLLLACLLFFIVIRWIGDQRLLPMLGGLPNYPPEVGFGSFAIDNLTYGLLPIGFGALVRAVESQFMALRRQLELAHQQRLSELDMLRAHIAPHFLFNTLNNLYALAQRPHADLSNPIHDLAELMRYTAKNEQAFVPVHEERAQVERYIALQTLRFPTPVHVRIDIDARANASLIPAMVLLPLVENAFKHGDPCDPRSPVSLTVHADGDRLLVSCTNSIGKHHTDDGTPTGNRNLARRMQLLFGPHATTRFGPRADGLFAATLHLPITTTTDAALDLSGDR